MGEVGRRRAGFVFSGTSIQGTSSGPKGKCFLNRSEVSAEWWLSWAYLIININQKIKYFLFFASEAAAVTISSS